MLLLSFLLLLIFSLFLPYSYAQTVDELNQKLNDQKVKIEALNREIAEKQKELQKIGGEKSTLQSEIRLLELSRSKLESDIKKTETQINKAETTINKLGVEINSLEEQKARAKEVIASSLKVMSQIENESPIEAFLQTGSISKFYMRAAESEKLSKALEDRLSEIKVIQGDLSNKQKQTEKERESLISLRKNLSGERASVETTKKTKDSLLSVTQNKEAEYQRILQQKIAEKASFEKALFETESQLKIVLDPNSFATSKPGILQWPLANVRITQYFGATADAKRLYVSGTHNGVDFGAPDGTPLLAALSGTVKAIGNTDGGGCYSYGKWILLEHNNGLSTLYAHLSSFAVEQGDTVKTGDIIGYSGRTGYATGPHLHFTVFATQGVRVQQYTNSVNCKNSIIPIADPKAYLDPMTYLPSL